MFIKTPLKKFDNNNIQKIIHQLEFPSNILADLDKKNALEIINILTNTSQYERAISFLALGLPAREVIWWAYICAKHVEMGRNNPLINETMSLIESWVKHPEESLRTQAGIFGEQLEYYTPSSWVAIAIFWSGGSIVSAEKPPVYPSQFMCQQAATNAILLTIQHMKNISSAQVKFLKCGLHIAMGGNGDIE